MFNYSNKNLILSELSICVILAIILGTYFKFYTFINGGSISVELIPLLLFCFKNKFKYSILCCVCFGIIKFILEPYIPPTQNFLSIFLSIIFDYIFSTIPISFASTFLFFLKTIKLSNRFSYFLSVFIILILRFIVYFFSGIIIWSSFSLDSVKFSFFYNLSYCLPEGIIIFMLLNLFLKKGL